MTYEAVKSQVGNLLLPEPISHVDDKGNGQVWLANDVQRFTVHCNVRFENGRVISSNILNERYCKVHINCIP